MISISRTAAFILAALITVSLGTGTAYSWGRNGYGAQPHFQNTGNTGAAFAVSVTTSAATLVYTQDVDDREILLQNTDPTYYIYCGTHSAVGTASGARFYIPPRPGSITTNGTYNIYCISAGTATFSVIGIREYDNRD